MVFAYARPMLRRESSKAQFRLRVPKRVQLIARGRKGAAMLPNPGAEPEVVSFTIGREVKFSLRTADPALLRLRHAEAHRQVQDFFAALTEAPKALSTKQVAALAGELYKIWSTTLEDNPGSPAMWQRVIDMNDAAQAGDMPFTSLKILPGDAAQRASALNERFGPFADLMLTRARLNTDQRSRERLVEAIALAMTKAAERLKRAANFDYSPDPAEGIFPKWEHASDTTRPPKVEPSSRLTLTRIYEDWARIDAAKTNKAAATVTDYRGTFRKLAAFLKHERAWEITEADIRRFVEHRRETVKDKTIIDSDLPALRSVLNWAVRSGRLAKSPVPSGTLLKKPRTPRRSKSVPDDVASAVLRHAHGYTAGRTESPKMTAAKRWVPLLAAYTGARALELCQLRKCDVFEASGLWAIRITPEAGTVKTKEAREVPLHPHLLELGFVAFAKRSGDGPLFYDTDVVPNVPRAKSVANRVRDFLNEMRASDGVAPLHGWRHRFGTVCDRVGTSEKIARAIHGPRAR